MIEIRKGSGKILAQLPDDTPRPLDLSGRDLSHARITNLDLRGVNLRDANLSYARFVVTDLTGACLENAKFKSAVFHKATLSEVNARGARFDEAEFLMVQARSADFQHADLSGTRWLLSSLEDASLVRCLLDYAYFREVQLRGCRLSQSVFANTAIVSCPDLHEARGLSKTLHMTTSPLDVETLRNCLQELPNVFLVGCGYSEDEIENLRALYATGIQFYSCFLSHADPDSEFADKLRRDLVANNVSCWHYRHDMQGGKHWRTQVQTAIKLHDKLVLICSENSVLRQNVVDEIIAAIERERETGEQKLFPIRLDDFILSRDILDIADAAMESGKWREDWVRYVRAYHIPNFSRWKDLDCFTAEFKKLLRDLKNPNPR